MIIRALSVVCLLILSCGGARAAESDSGPEDQAAAAKLQAYLNTLTSFEAQFTQTISGATGASFTAAITKLTTAGLELMHPTLTV